MRIPIRSMGLVLVALLAVSGSTDAGTRGKSMRKALALSLLLPGAGQQYLGNHARARTMYAAEAGVWSAFACFRIQGDNRKDRYEQMAELFAGVSGHMDDEYYRALSYYLTSDDYNIDVMREARFRYPQDREKQLEYFEANAVFGDDGWEWQSPEYQSEFARIRTASKQSYRRAVLSTGFAVLNRVVSLIDVYLTFRLDDTGNSSFHPQLKADRNGDDGFRVYLSTSF
jgi:hypothetical protein